MVHTRSRAAAEPSFTVNPHHHRFSTPQTIDLTDGASSFSSSPPRDLSLSPPNDDPLVSSPSSSHYSSSPSLPQTTTTSPPFPSPLHVPQSHGSSSSPSPLAEQHDSPSPSPSHINTEQPILCLPPLSALPLVAHNETPPPGSTPKPSRYQRCRRTTRLSAQPTASNDGASSNTMVDTTEQPMSPDPPRR
ncbi:uncharacterized protein LOC108455415 [Gossypium arboreum]|uniref:uncharacterized protein LOC108455415 n=1 Tax=Gossypium arboreum TaxID=29729 RepID=UPI000818F3BD|nr:uncharacterized protein LOC108455415 [Gossypium arboreum]